MFRSLMLAVAPVCFAAGAQAQTQILNVSYDPILGEPPVAVVDKVVDQKGTRKVAESYLRYLYSRQAQEPIAKHYNRPRLPEVAAKYDSQFPEVNLFTIDELFGGWQKAQAERFLMAAYSTRYTLNRLGMMRKA